MIHYCVTNMPGAVARTSTFALNNATLPFVLALADKGWRQAIADDPHLRNGLNDSIETSHNLHQRALNAYNWMLNHTADHECKEDVWHWRKERMVCDICWRREDWRKDLQDLAAIMNNITRLEAVRKEHG